MKKSQILVATLCASALVLSACTIGRKPSKKKKSSSQDVPTSVVPGPTSSGTTTSGTSGTPAPTPTSGTSTAPVKVVQRIDVTNAPTTTVYTAGQNFDPTGMVVTATYSDGSTANVTDQCQFSPTVLTENTASVTITFGGQSTTQAVTVNAPVIETWSNEEKAIFASELYGYEIPYFTGHHSGMTLQAMSDGGVSYSGGTSSTELIQEYVALVPASFDMKRSTNESIYAYVGETEITVENEIRHVQLAVFGVTTSESGSSISADGSGTFMVQAYDPYYYEWSEFKHDTDLVASIFASIGTAAWRSDDLIEVEVPELTGEGIYYEYYFDGFEDFYTYQIYYELNVEPIADASIEIVAYCAQDQYDEYLENLDFLTDAWQYVGSYNNGYYLVNVYNSLFGKASIEVGYYAPAEIAFIDVCASSSEVFPSKQVLDYIALDRENPQSFPILDVEKGSYYVNEFDSSIFVDLYVYDNAEFTQATVDAYVEGLDPTKFSYEKIQNESYDLSGLEDLFALRADEEEEDLGYYYYVMDLEYKYTFFVEYIETELSDGTIEKLVEWQIQYEVEHLSEFPSSDVDKFYSDAEITAPVTPSYSAAGESHYFQEFSDESGIEIHAYGTSEAEMLAYIAALSSAGYVGEVDGEGKPVFDEYGYYVMEVPSEETHAKVTIQNALEEDGYVGVLFEPGYVDWTQAQKDKFMTDLGVIPPFIKGLQDYIGTQYDMYYAELEEAYGAEVIAAFKSDANWTEKSANVFTSTSELGYAQAEFNTDYLEQEGVYVLYLTFEQTQWDKEDADAFAAVLHGIIPPYIRGGLYSPVTAGHNFEGNGLFTDEQLVEVEAAFQEAGWTITGSGHEAVYTKNADDGTGYAQITWSEYNAGTYFFFIDWVDGGTPVPPTPGEAVTASKTIAEIATANSWANSTQYASFSLDDSITVSCAGGANSGKYYTSGNQWRLYASESCTMTITAPTGYVITSVTVTYDSNNNGSLSYNGSAVASGTAVAIDNQQSVTFNVVDQWQQQGDDHGQARVTAISVTYAPASN